MNRYLKLFLATGIPFGIFMIIFNSFQHGISSGLVTGAVEGIFFGIFMSLVLGFMHSRSVKRMSSGESDEAMGVHHVRNVELRLDYDMVFKLCIESLSRIKKCKIKNEDRSKGKLIAKAGMTWKTFGDVISFEIHKMGDDRIQVEVSSRPSLRTTLVDYGKNLENVERIVEFLNAHSESTV